jgi:hypothetical protein
MPDFSTFWNSKDQLSFAFRLGTLASIGVTALLGLMLYMLNDRIGDIQQRIIDTQGHQLGKQGQILDRQNGLLEEQSSRLSAVNKGLAEAVQRSQTLLQKNADLQASVGRVADANAVLQKRADDLTTKATAAERGVGNIYDFNGAHRLRTAGRTMVTVGEESQVFQRLNEMQAAHRWLELLSTSEAQIAKTPSWLTPYLFAGIAEANLGNFDAARLHLQHVVVQAGGDPDYAVAQHILGQLPH